MERRKVAVLGAGKMGAAIVKTLANAGHEVTVWNRSPDKCEPLKEHALVAGDVPSAVTGMDIVIMSLSNYEASQLVLQADGVAAALSGSTLVQATSGTPSDARASEKWAHANKVDYLDAAILGYPSFIGADAVTIFYSGKRPPFDRNLAVLNCLAGNSVFVDESVGAASTIDCAILEAYYGGSIAMLHGAALCQSEGISPETFFEYKDAFVGLIGITADQARPMVNERTYEGEQCAIDTHHAALGHILNLARDNNLEDAVPKSLLDSFELAVKAGNGRMELAAVFESFFRK